jgi:transporter family protein
MLDQKCLRMTRLSISLPARKVSRIAPKPARKFTHSLSWSPMVLPATAPTMISTNATDIATRIEMIEASSASPSQTAETSHTFSIARSFLRRTSRRSGGREDGMKKPASRRVIGERHSHRMSPRGRSHQPSRAVLGDSIPLRGLLRVIARVVQEGHRLRFRLIRGITWEKSMNLSWQLWAILAAAFAALTAIFAKVGVAGVNADFATFIRTVVIVVALCVMLLSTGQWQSLGAISGRSYVFLVLSGLATGGSWLCYFRALQLGDAARVAPIDKLSVVMVAVFGVVFLGETLSLPNWLGIAMIGGGAVLVAYQG